MKETLKKGFYVGLGAGLLLRDEILSRLSPPVRVNDKPLDEAREHLREALAKVSETVDKGVDAARQAGEEELAGFMERLGLANAGEVQTLKDRIAELERQLAEKKGE